MPCCALQLITLGPEVSLTQLPGAKYSVKHSMNYGFLAVYELDWYMLCDYMWCRSESPTQCSKRRVMNMMIWYVLPCDICLMFAQGETEAPLLCGFEYAL